MVTQTVSKNVAVVDDASTSPPPSPSDDVVYDSSNISVEQAGYQLSISESDSAGTFTKC